jgi:hypothetical protein
MSAQTDITAFAQSVYSRIKNRFYDTITDTDGQTFITLVVDFANGFIDELENELDASGKPIDWWWVRQNGATLGTAATGSASIAFNGTTYNNLIAEEGRYVQLVLGGAVIANFAVVSPGDISNDTSRVTEDMCARVGSNLVFSRTFKSIENGATIIGDVTTPIPRLVYDTTNHSNDNSNALSVIKPRELFVLGVAKNESLPDIVQGKLSPSFVQKFNDLLTNAVARSAKSSLGDTVQRDDFGNIGGVGF